MASRISKQTKLSKPLKQRFWAKFYPHFPKKRSRITPSWPDFDNFTKKYNALVRKTSLHQKISSIYFLKLVLFPRSIFSSTSTIWFRFRRNLLWVHTI